MSVVSTTRTAWSLSPASTVTTKCVPGTAAMECVSPPAWAVSLNCHSLPAGWIVRPSGSTRAPGIPATAPVRASAAPVGAVAVHWPDVGVGYAPFQLGHAASCGMAAQAPAARHAYGVFCSLQPTLGQSYAHECGARRYGSGLTDPPVPPPPVAPAPPVPAPPVLVVDAEEAAPPVPVELEDGTALLLRVQPPTRAAATKVEGSDTARSIT